MGGTGGNQDTQRSLLANVWHKVTQDVTSSVADIWYSVARHVICKGNPNSLDEQLFSQDLVRGNPKYIYK
jgi:hypothetical protein